MGTSRASKSRSQEHLKVHGLDDPVEVRRHPAARRMTLRVSRTSRSVIVTVPMQCDLRHAGKFLSTHLDWVRERLTNMPTPQPFQHGGLVPLRGIPHRIVFVGPQRGAPVVDIINPARGKPELRVSGGYEFAPRRLRDWLISEARKDLTAQVRYHADNLSLRAGRLSVRDQTSRWGSCSSTGNLSFSWRLIMAPALILDYVAAHEVCHLAEMNHGRRFWALVRKTCPKTEEAKNWLNIYGLDLHRYGAQV